MMTEESRGKTKKNRKKQTKENGDENQDCQEEKLPSCPRVEGDGEPALDKATEMTDLEDLKHSKRFQINLQLDIVAVSLFLLGIFSRFYRLEEPRNIVFDELHYGRYVSMYMKRTFFFDLHPPLGKQLVALVAYLADFDGDYRFSRIGKSYEDCVPVFALRFVPALCGSMIIPAAYHVMLELGFEQWTATLAAFLLLCDNALLTQSRFILMESMLLLFTLLGVLWLLKFRKVHSSPGTLRWWCCLSLSSLFVTLALSVKFAGFFSCLLLLSLVWRDFFSLLSVKTIKDRTLIWHGTARAFILTLVPVSVYLFVFWSHLTILNRAGPHDTIMTSAFQASLEGGLASITKGQPLEVAHGSQITLRHTHGRACWLHSHNHVYPIRYPDKRGSSHQQQVTCYIYKDVNNWWIVKRPEETYLAVKSSVDVIVHGDIIQLIHGMTNRALNSHDVSAPMSPQNQEVSGYIDYNISMPSQNLWRVEIENRDQVGDVWHTIESRVRLIHVNSSQALKFSGLHLPDWGFNQFEIVTDKVVNHDGTLWNVEEHRYTKSDDAAERELDMVNAEMIPLRPTSLSFWDKFLELQYKMIFSSTQSVMNHMYSSEPMEWPLMTRGIAYWVSREHNGQVHLLGNIVVWYSGTICILLYSSLLIFYLIRRRRKCYDINKGAWEQFVSIGEVLFAGYLFHFVPYFFVDRALFIHHYLPAFTFKVLLTAAMAEHLATIIKPFRWLRHLFNWLTVLWVMVVFVVFRKFSVLSYGVAPLSAGDVTKLRWKETWDFIVHK